MDHRDRKLEFFLVASHQLKAPVAIIQWCLQTIMEDPNVPPVTRSLITKSLTQADAMSKLIGDMLHVFRLTEKTNETLEPVDINKLLDEVVKQYDVIAERHKVHLVVGPVENLPIILGSAGYLKQAVINLVDNGIKYSRSGGKVTLTAATCKDGFINIAVKDQGIGISESEQSRLFTEFFRGVEAKETAGEGTGLGLVLVKHIVELYGGHVRVETAQHKGSTFTIRLPYK